MITAVALGVVGMIGAIGLIARPVITGVNAIIAAATALGTVFTTVAGGIITAIGAISAGCRCCGCDCRRGIAHP